MSRERQFILIGEAFNQLLLNFPEEKNLFPEAPRIISFRTRLTHAYRTISDDVVWGIMKNSLSSFCTKIYLLYQERCPE
ncbi:DUF86 domain-containing protein [uncultured Methanospirillum sp.]|uniref:HepT-like ribonuclease domain-containing protein n=1 Tax=uncultured Methanospirillum sp. TaxID=262503 RepID=UPI003748492B